MGELQRFADSKKEYWNDKIELKSRGKSPRSNPLMGRGSNRIRCGRSRRADDRALSRSSALNERKASRAPTQSSRGQAPWIAQREIIERRFSSETILGYLCGDGRYLRSRERWGTIVTFKKGEGGDKPGSKNKLTLAKAAARAEAMKLLNESLPADAFLAMRLRCSKEMTQIQLSMRSCVSRRQQRSLSSRERNSHPRRTAKLCCCHAGAGFQPG